MTSILERDSFDPRHIEFRRIAVGALVLFVIGAAWHGLRGPLMYRAACSSVGCPGREGLIVAALRRADPHFADEPQLWNCDPAGADWIAWSSVREVIPLADGWQRPKWQVTVADRGLVVRGVIAGDRLAAPPADADGDGRCEVMKEFYPPQDAPQRELQWRAVVRLGDEYNEIVWAGMIDCGMWHSRQTRLKPIWQDTEGDGMDELVFITVKTARTPEGGVVFKPPGTVAVFEWDSSGGMLRPRLFPEDCGITLWTPIERVPLRFGRETDLDPIVRELLPISPR